jgi:hypothetical protein
MNAGYSQATTASATQFDHWELRAMAAFFAVKESG